MDFLELIENLATRARDRARELRKRADDYSYRTDHAYELRERARSMDQLAELMEELRG